MKNLIPSYFKLLLFHYILGIIFFFIFRLIFFFLNTDISSISENEYKLVQHAFKIGFQFDSVIMGYILVLPLLILEIFSFSKYRNQLIKYSNYYILSLIFIAFFISSADIPYFNYNFARISAVIFEWISDTGIIISMIIEEPSYAIYTLLFFLFFTSYAFLSFKASKRTQKQALLPNNKKTIIINGLTFLVTFFLIFLTMRGRIDSPIRINHAFFCNNSFYNQLGLNPVFTLLKSAKQNASIKIYDSELALKKTQKYLEIEKQNNSFPLARKIESDNPDSTFKTPNIVLIIMESMSANKLTQFGNNDNLTPFLDSLAEYSINFKNIYSAGRHTCNGVFSVLYSYPAVLRERPMSALNLNHFSSLPEVFQKLNYTNLYFTSHSETFDNIGEFLPLNNIEHVFSLKDYDPSLINNSFGIPDHVLLNYAIKEMDNLYSENKKFFTTIMTISDHGPYVIPKNISFTPRSTDIQKQIVEYADWSIMQFMQNAQTKKWFNNTIFIFVADHGVVEKKSVYEVPLSLHHIPFLIFSADTNLVKAKEIYSFGNQTDVLPTLSGLLNISYTNNSFGIDLLKHQRPFSYFSSDDKLGCIDNKFYYIYRIDGHESLYLYKSKDPKNVIQEYPEQTKKMKDYVISMTQASKWIIDNKKTSLTQKR